MERKITMRAWGFLMTFLLSAGCFGQQAANGSFNIIPAGETNVKEALDLAAARLRLTQNERLVPARSENTAQGGRHDHYRITFKNVPVEHSALIVHSRQGIVTSVNGRHEAADDRLNVSPALSREEAFESARRALNATKYDNRATAAGAALVILEGKLAWRCEVRALEPLAAFKMYIDAQTGRELKRISLLQTSTGKADTRYSNTRDIETSPVPGGHILKDNTRGNGIHTRYAPLVDGAVDLLNPADLKDSDNTWSAAEYNASKQDALFDVHWGIGLTYDYWLDKHQKSGFNAMNPLIKAVMVDPAAQYANASWDGFQLAFGGGKAPDSDPWTTLDIVAHEYGHAICQYTCNLVYEKEPGALNEGFSDIWGMCLEIYANQQLGTGKNPWINGEGFQFGGLGYLRSFENPNDAAKPDTYRGDYWVTGAYDNYGVHFNSTVFSHWFYLLAQPVGSVKTGENDFSFYYSVAGIGIDDAEKIAFLAESQYMHELSDYEDARAQTIAAASFLFGPNSNQVAQVTAAWLAVGVPYQLCKGGSDDVSKGWIAGVEVFGLFSQNDNTVSPSGYTDYSDDPAAVFYAKKGTVYNMKLTPTVLTGPDQWPSWRVWIDYNANGKFDPDTEKIYSGAAPGTVNFSFKAPAAAKIGHTRMRVQMELPPYQSAHPCDTVLAGEVEDYHVVLSPASCDPPSAFNPEITGPNAIGFYAVDLHFTDYHYIYNYEYEIWKPGTALAASGTVEMQTVSVSKVTNPFNGTWEYRMRSVCPLGNSDWSPVQTINIPCLPDVPEMLPVSPGMSNATIFWDDPKYTAGFTYRLEYKKLADAAWAGINTTTNTYLNVSLDPGTPYMARVARLCDNVPGGWSDTVEFITLCHSYVSNDFTLQQVNGQLSSAGVPYEDFTDFTLFKSTQKCIYSILPPEKYKIEVNIKASEAKAFVTAAIDYDHDGYFSAYEIVVPSTQVATNQPVTLPEFSICMPGMKAGQARLRIISSRYDFPAGFKFCSAGPNGESYGFGQVEDYSVEIEEFKPWGEEEEGEKKLLLYPNPVIGLLEWQAPQRPAGSRYTLTVSDPMGFTLVAQRGSGTAGTADLSGLRPGTYVVKLAYESGEQWVAQVLKN